jgi:leucyl aminopeptidase
VRCADLCAALQTQHSHRRRNPDRRLRDRARPAPERPDEQRRQLAREILRAGIEAEDRAWHLPIAEEYDEELKSNFADFANVAGREGGAITAACFLARFTRDLAWAHLDIAGTAWKTGKAKGATGRPVPLLAQFLMSRAGVA